MTKTSSVIEKKYRYIFIRNIFLIRIGMHVSFYYSELLKRFMHEHKPDI